MAKLLDRVTDDKEKMGDEARSEYKAAFARLKVRILIFNMTLSSGL